MCVILFTKINDSNIIFKNRDRFYNANVKIIHELNNGIELAYIYDEHTGWIEGMNEYGIGIINSTFTIAKDHKQYEIDNIKKNINQARDYDSIKGHKIKTALTKSNIIDAIKFLVSDDNSMEGHTLVCSNKICYHIEHRKKNPEYVINEIKQPVSFTNHGINFPEEGNISGEKAVSSVLRKAECDYELNSNTITDQETLFDITNKYYINTPIHLYRDSKDPFYKEIINFFTLNNDNKMVTTTTSQMLLNLTEKELIYNHDKNNSSFLGIDNKLPYDYEPVIKIKILETSKNYERDFLTLHPKIIQEIYNKFSYKKDAYFNDQVYIVLFLLLIFVITLFIFKKNSIKSINLKSINLKSIKNLFRHD
jgi:hypothetical protein